MIPRVRSGTRIDCRAWNGPPGRLALAHRALLAALDGADAEGRLDVDAVGLRSSRSPHAQLVAAAALVEKMVPEADGTIEAAMRVQRR